MALTDIKIAGVLSSVLRFGWPWHGIIAGGVVGATEQPHTQPTINESWLIDIGLPAPDLTPEQIASEAAYGREWRNYALLPRGTVYNRAIGNDSFIHVDEAGKPWRIDLAFSFPASQTLRITADITEFGVLEMHEGPATAVTIQKTADVVCTEIELLNAVSQQSGAGVAYESRTGTIQDVWTNGSKALVGVLLHKAGLSDLFAVVTLTLSGEGGADGTGLALAAVETIAQPALTVGTESVPTADIYTPHFQANISYSGNCEDVCPPSYTGAYTMTFTLNVLPDPYLTGGGNRNCATYARIAYFDNATGAAKAIRLRFGFEDTWQETMTTGWSIDLTEGEGSCAAHLGIGCGVGYDGPYPSAAMIASRVDTYEYGYWVLENDAIIDKITWAETDTYNKDYSYVFGRSPPFLGQIDSGTHVLATVRGGALAAYLPAALESIVGGSNLVTAFRYASEDAYSAAASVSGGVVSLGIHRMNSHAVALMAANASTSSYGLAATPLGPLTVGLAPAATTNFAMQRKTGDYTFAANPICYV